VSAKLLPPDSTEQPKPGREPDGKFLPGQSGNPSGRPGRLAEHAARIRSELGPLAIEAHKKLLADPDPRIVGEAVALVYDRGWGKAPQAAPIVEDGYEKDTSSKPFSLADLLLKKLQQHAGEIDENGRPLPPKPKPDMSRLSLEELHQLDSLGRKMRGEPEPVLDEYSKARLAKDIEEDRARRISDPVADPLVDLKRTIEQTAGIDIDTFAATGGKVALPPEAKK
jgi:hypothetical protein